MSAEAKNERLYWRLGEKYRISMNHFLFIILTLLIIFTTLDLPMASAVCTSEQFTCKITKNCISKSFLCDDDPDCGGSDLSDEENCPSCVLRGRFECQITKQCLPSLVVCDGEFDCGLYDFSDEENCEYSTLTSTTEIPCLPSDFRCSSTDQCISSELKCNGFNDCGDYSDETNCTIKKLCAHNEFLCQKENRCIPISYKCDGDNDCGDRSDELNCYRSSVQVQLPGSSCSSYQFQCKITKQCIRDEYRCDGDEDCGSTDKSDEENCESCNRNRFLCPISKRCIPTSYKCDGGYDCGDLSDEINCSNFTRSCSTNEFRCNATNRCITLRSKCDGDNDCGDWSDEVNCTTKRRLHVCSRRQFPCKNSTRCVGVNYLCDGDNDCGDLSDEENCGHKTTILNGHCADNYFRCDNGYCLRRSHLCDTKNDCLDNSDERGCVNIEPCYDKEFRCSNGTCLHRSAICNGDFDCQDGADEIHCSLEICSGFWCHSSSKCLSKSNICDLEYDCEDKSDEHDCPAALKISPYREHILGRIGHTSRWIFNVTSNRNDLTLVWKNPDDSPINYTLGKHKVVVSRKTELLLEMILEIHNVTWEDSGYYTVYLKIHESNVESRFHYLRLKVQGHTKPEMVYTNMQNSTLTVVSGTRIELICNISHPKTRISWSLDNKPLNIWSPKLGYKLYESNQVLVVGPVTKEIEGRIMCKSESMSGVIVAYADVRVTTLSDRVTQNCYINTISLGAILFLLFVVGFVIVVRYEKREKKLRAMLNTFNKCEFSKRNTANNNGSLIENERANLVL